MAVVIFDVQAWREAYPQFDGQLTDGQLKQAFRVAELMCDNTESSPIPYDPPKTETREVLLWLLVCHLASLALRPANQAGPTTGATEGTVSAQFAVPKSLNGEYFTQTPCGASYWQAIKKFTIGGRYYGERRFHPWG